MSTRREFLSNMTAAGMVTAACGRYSLGLAAPMHSQPTTSMKTYKIPHTDLVVSRLAYGCALVGTDERSADFADRLLPMIRTAYEHGITFFDLADTYGAGNAEIALGAVLKQSPGLRARIVIQSKCGDTKTAVVDSSYTHIVRAAEGSLKRLSTEHLDILLLHGADQLVEPQEVAKAFDELHRSGKVRCFGVSNHSPDQIELLRRYVRQPIVANQILLGLFSWSTIDELHPASERVSTINYCRAHDIQMQAHSPLRQSYAVTPRVFNPTANLTPAEKNAADLLAEIAQRHDATPVAVVLAWLLRHPAGIVPVVGGTNPEHLIADCAADRVDLNPQEWYGLLEAAAAISSS